MHLETNVNTILIQESIKHAKSEQESMDIVTRIPVHGSAEAVMISKLKMRWIARIIVGLRHEYTTEYSIDGIVWTDTRPDVHICKVRHEDFYDFDDIKIYGYIEAVNEQVRRMRMKLIGQM